MKICISKFKSFIKKTTNDRKRLFFALACLVVIVTITSLITMAVRGNPTEPVSSIVIESDNYDDAGSWQVTKSAKWTNKDKALITFDVNTIPQTNGHYKDIVFVIDVSGSMVGERLAKAKENSIELVNYLLNDENNRIALITFDTSSEILSGFTNDKDTIVSAINNITYKGATNYNAALKNVQTVLEGYEQEDNRDLVTLFLTDGLPNEETPNQVGMYEILKESYPYMDINGVQYEMGSSVMNEIKAISDKQWVASMGNLHNVLFDAVLEPLVYEKYEIVDYIDKDYFIVNSTDDIKVSIGTVKLEEEDGYQKVTWNLGSSFITGGEASMTIDASLKDEYVTEEGLYPTNDREIITSKVVNNEEIVKESDKTPVLKNYYDVVYDTNLPDGCELDDIEAETHLIFTNVNKKQDKLSCSGYNFQGWEIVNNDVVRINDDVFYMPESDVNIKAIWSKPDISKSMEGKIYEKTTLYKAVESEALNGTQAKQYTGETDDGGGSENVYYYTGDNVNKNNVVFANYCWQIVRTTNTGGVKMVYNGAPDASGKCGTDRGTYNNVGYGVKTTRGLTGTYPYGTSYTYDKTTKTFTLTNTESIGALSNDNKDNIIGKFTCGTTSNSCTTLYYVDSYSSGSTAYVVPLNNSTAYYHIGTSAFNSKYNSPAYVGYMYNKVYNYSYKTMESSNTILQYTSLNTEYYYADSYEVNGSNYQLKNSDESEIKRMESSTNYSNMVGKYTFRNSTNPEYTSSYLYYIVAVKGSTMYYIQLSNGNDLEDVNTTYKFSKGITDNGDGTYTLSGDITTIKKSDLTGEKDWYTKYASVKNMYTCNDDSDTCRNPYYTTATSNTNYTYVSVANDYIYGKSFKYENGEYKLDYEDNTTHFFDFPGNYSSLNNYHYTCFNTSGKCEVLYYIYYVYSDYQPYYISLRDGNSVEDALKQMLSNNDVNQTDSTIKQRIDSWYKINMTKYEDYLEDTVFCNDRSIRSLNGWNPNGRSISSYLQFKEYSATEDLKCPNNIDRFTKADSIGNGALDYPVGLLSQPEANLWGSTARNDGYYWWLGSPSSFYVNYAFERRVYFGDLYGDGVYGSLGVRPAVSLAPGTEYTKGDGTTDSPFYIPTEG